jgi:hypothetical protein
VLFDMKFGTVLRYTTRNSELFCVISNAGFSLNLYSRFGYGKPEPQRCDEKQAYIENCTGAHVDL